METSDAPGALPESPMRGWKLLQAFARRLEEAALRHAAAATEADPRRRLHRGEYLSLLLFGLWNPVVETMRGLCAATHLQRLQQEVCARPVSLGSFSEAQAVIDPALLESVLGELSQEAGRAASLAAGQEPLRALGRTLCAIDSSLWRALPRMGWALWRTQAGVRQRAVRLHVKFCLLHRLPLSARATEGALCERKAWKALARAGDFFVADRYYGEDYRLLEELDARGVFFLVRLREAVCFVRERALALEAEDEAAGVQEHWLVRLGRAGRGPALRLIEVAGEETTLLLATNQPLERLPAGLAALLYRQRWQVELFFRWIKCILGCRHFFCESERGVALQLYLALIGALLVVLYLGRRPSRREMELLRFYFLGYASLEETCRLLTLNPDHPP